MSDNEKSLQLEIPVILPDVLHALTGSLVSLRGGQASIEFISSLEKTETLTKYAFTTIKTKSSYPESWESCNP